MKSDSASVVIPELDFEIPSTTQKGVITTVEGLLSEAASGLRSTQVSCKMSNECLSVDQHLLTAEHQQSYGSLQIVHRFGDSQRRSKWYPRGIRFTYMQSQRRDLDASSADAVDAFLVRLDACIAAEQDFSVVLDDPAGSFFGKACRRGSETDYLT